ncbi:MAG TPA: hypothetical protein VLH84_04525 [Patescibacteria group bacterium]|nr:hypothetical protein [Patescibacteria group bacterium]
MAVAPEGWRIADINLNMHGNGTSLLVDTATGAVMALRVTNGGDNASSRADGTTIEWTGGMDDVRTCETTVRPPIAATEQLRPVLETFAGFVGTITTRAA